MYRYRRLIGTIVLGASLLGMPVYAEEDKDNTDPAAKKMLLSAFEKMDQTKGVHFDSTRTMEIKRPEDVSKEEYIIEGTLQNPDITYLEVSENGTEFEVYQKGSQTIKGSEKKGWRDYSWHVEPFPIERIKSYKNCLENVRFSGEEKLRGKKCRIIVASLDSQGREKLGQSYRYALSPPYSLKIKIADSLFKIWIGEDDSLPYRVIFSFSIDYAVFKDTEPLPLDDPIHKNFPTAREMTLEIDLFDYDKDVKIEIPDEAKEVLGLAGEVEAQKILLQALKNVDQTKGFHFEFEETLESITTEGETKREFIKEGKGIWQNPDSICVKGSKGDQEFEIYQKGNFTVRKEPESGKWETLPRPTYPSPIEWIKTGRDFLKNMKFTGKEKLKGIDCLILEASADFQDSLMDRDIDLYRQIWDKISNLEIVGLMSCEKCTKSVYEIWIGEKDSLPYKMVLFRDREFEFFFPPGKELDIPVGQKTRLEINLFNYNKDTEIKIPEEVSKILVSAEDDLEIQKVVQKVVRQAVNRMDQTKGFHFEAEETSATETGEKTSETKSTMKGVWQNPTMMYLKRCEDEKEFEVYQKGDKVMRKDATNEKWELFHTSTFLPLPIDQIKTYQNYLTKTQFSGEGKLKDKDCKIVEGSLNSEGVGELAYQVYDQYGLWTTGLRVEDIKITKSLYKIWIGKNGSLPYKVVFSFSIEYPTPEIPTKTLQETRLETNLFDYDKDIEIKIPQDLKELFEKGEKKGE